MKTKKINRGAKNMFVTKEEFKNLNVKEVFESGKNFIKITDGRHAIYWVNDRY
ncbi:hypothetical protein ACVXZY_10555 [Staphylococcus aureus]